MASTRFIRAMASSSLPGDAGDPRVLLRQRGGHLGVDVGEELLRPRGHDGFEAGHGLGHLPVGLGRDGGLALVVQESLFPHVAGQPDERVPLEPGGHLLFPPVSPGVVGRGVVGHPVGVRLDQGGPAAVPGAVERLAHHL